jgi:hypothetical protein
MRTMWINDFHLGNIVEIATFIELHVNMTEGLEPRAYAT